MVKIKSVSLNYRDLAIATGVYPFNVKDSVVPCSDMAGEVLETGLQVKSFNKGDRVIASFYPNTLYGTVDDRYYGLGGGLDGVLQEYKNFSEHSLVKVPEMSTMTDAEAACLVCTGVTAWNALYGNIPLRPGQTVLMLGTGGVSITALQIANAAGARTIITSSSNDKLKFVKDKYGADHLINYKDTPNWEEEVLRITKGRGADNIIETVGVGTIEKSIASVAYGGIISIIGFLSGVSPQDRPDVAALALGKGAVVRGIVVGSKQQLEEVTTFAVINDIHLAVNKEFPFTDSGIKGAYE